MKAASRIANAAVYLRKWKNSSMYDKMASTYTGMGEDILIGGI